MARQLHVPRVLDAMIGIGCQRSAKAIKDAGPAIVGVDRVPAGYPFVNEAQPAAPIERRNRDRHARDRRVRKRQNEHEREAPVRNDLGVFADVFDRVAVISIDETESAPNSRIDFDVRDRPRRRREEPSSGQRRIEPRAKDTLGRRVEAPREPQRSAGFDLPRSTFARSPTSGACYLLGHPMMFNYEGFGRSRLRFHFACPVLKRSTRLNPFHYRWNRRRLGS